LAMLILPAIPSCTVQATATLFRLLKIERIL
jgi:hypothetical protein